MSEYIMIKETGNAPITVAKLVRCKDCKWYKKGYDIDGKWFTRCNGDVRVYGQTKPDWFCADGKMREGD